MPARQTTELDQEFKLLFSDPRAPKAKRRSIAKELLPAPKPNMDGVNTWTLLQELYKRHAATIYTVGFWLELAIILWIKLK